MVRIERLPNVKIIRAEVIRDRLPPGIRKLICLSCGNASKALARTIKHVPVIELDRTAPVMPTRELTEEEILKFFGGDSLNVTSGYLPLDWTEVIGQRLLGFVLPSERYFVPCGSGETMMALSFFIPLRQLVGVTASYPPIEMVGPLSRWLRKNADIRHAGRVDSVIDALKIVGREPGIALCWE